MSKPFFYKSKDEKEENNELKKNETSDNLNLHMAKNSALIDQKLPLGLYELLTNRMSFMSHSK